MEWLKDLEAYKVIELSVTAPALANIVFTPLNIEIFKHKISEKRFVHVSQRSIMNWVVRIVVVT